MFKVHTLLHFVSNTQNFLDDFCKGGSLAVPHGEDVVPLINALRERVSFDYVFFSKDWHPRDHCSFVTNHPGAHPFTLQQVTNSTLFVTLIPCLPGSCLRDLK